ncbi:hypothetical protein RCL1_007640 [Eukaryota sp. TZLM3-RCL]
MNTTNLPVKRRVADRLYEVKRARVETMASLDLSWIPVTTVAVDRLFSSARQVLGSLRCRLSPKMLNAELFLRGNSTLWDVKTVRQMLRQSCNSEELSAIESEFD